MGSAGSDGPAGPDEVPISLKIVIAGGFGVGKSTLVAAVSEIRSLHTEELISDRSAGIDSLRGIAGKATTTVALDFGRLSIDDGLVLYLFGTPGQERFWFMWDELARGAVGAVVLADTRRLADCFPAVDYFEQRRIPFVVAVNCFDGARRHPAPSIREALDLDPGLPVLLCDARLRRSCRDVLVTLVEHAARLIQAGRSRPAATSG
jgi:signal recognition particle receptor subunit beta